jgi:hypothetical protein
MNDLSVFQQILPLMIPVLIIQIILIVVALLDLRKQTATRGPKWLWVVIIVFVNFIGPIVYFVAGRKEE